MSTEKRRQRGSAAPDAAGVQKAPGFRSQKRDGHQPSLSGCKGWQSSFGPCGGSIFIPDDAFERALAKQMKGGK